MHADNLRQFQVNMETVARFAGYQGLQGNDAGEEPLGLCSECGEQIPVSELKSDGVCDSCFREFYLKGTVHEKAN